MNEKKLTEKLLELDSVSLDFDIDEKIALVSTYLLNLLEIKKELHGIEVELKDINKWVKK